MDLHAERAWLRAKTHRLQRRITTLADHEKSPGSLSVRCEMERKLFHLRSLAAGTVRPKQEPARRAGRPL